MREYKDTYKYEQYKRCTRVAKEKLERRVGGLEGWGSRRSANDLWFFCASLLSNRKNSRSEDVSPGESELPNEWCGECQVVYRDKHTCIDKSESRRMYWKSCNEHRHTGAGKEKTSKINIVKPVNINLNYWSVTLVLRRNNSNKETFKYIPCTSHHCILSSYNLSWLCWHSKKTNSQTAFQPVWMIYNLLTFINDKS